MLCVASHTARKNLGALVPAARALAAEGVELAVAGGHRPQFAAEQGLDALRLLGHVDDALLPGLYAGAEAFALPSLYEGFGLPVLEAMAAGTPVLTTTAGALPETCGGAARLVEDPAAFASELPALLADAGERARLRAAGLDARGELLVGAHRARDRRAVDGGGGGPAGVVRRRRKRGPRQRRLVGWWVCRRLRSSARRCGDARSLVPRHGEREGSRLT